MRKVILSLFCLTSLLFSQGFERPVPYDITSDFGPRNLTHYNWHRGIDYAALMWTPVEVVEDGNINEINYQSGSQGAGWYIRVAGDSATWTYMHLFQDGDNPISPDQRYEARMATLEDPTGQAPDVQTYIFVFWVDRNNNRAQKVLVPYRVDNQIVENWWVCARSGDPGYDPNNPYILDQTGNRVLTQGSVANREVVAPSGESGAGPFHLHVGAHRVYRYDINPLYYIIHPEPSYTLTIIEHPPVDAVLYHRPGAPEALQLNERIRVNINSNSTQGSDQGLDLDRGFVYFFKPSEPRVFDDVHRYARITYGGPPPNIPFPEPFPNRITINGEANRGVLTQSGVDPQGGEPGNDDFYFIGGFSEGGFQFNTKINTPGTGTARIHSEARFSDGPKDMVIRSHSIRWNFEDYYFDTEREDISIDNFKPYAARVRIEQALKTKEGERGVVKYEAHWPESPQSNTDLGELVPDTEGYCRTGLGITLTVEFSECVKRWRVLTFYINRINGIVSHSYSSHIFILINN